MYTNINEMQQDIVVWVVLISRCCDFAVKKVVALFLGLCYGESVIGAHGLKFY